MSPSAERLLRPLLAFATLCLAAFLLAPTVASVHHAVDALNVQRELPWNLFKWYEEPLPHPPTDCNDRDRQLYSEITRWPESIRKDKPFDLWGFVGSEQDARAPVATIEVDVFLNATKSEPGVFLGNAVSDANGQFYLQSSVPFELQAAHYHIVAHAKGKRMACADYFEHWSDPEVNILSSTRIVLDNATTLVAGRPWDIQGRLVDAVGGPVINVTVNVTISGKTTKFTTDGAGRFVIPHTPEKTGTLVIASSYGGSEYYDASRSETRFNVTDEAFALDGAPFLVTRSDPITITGHLYVSNGSRKDSFTLSFEGINVSTCPGCAGNSTIVVPLGEDGSFSTPLVVPSSEAAGVYTMHASGGGLREPRTTNLTVEVPTRLTLAPRSTGLFSRTYEADATLLDEAGRPVGGVPIAAEGPDGWRSGSTNASGSFVLAGSAACGHHELGAMFNGTDHVRPSAARAEAPVCGYLAFVPPWLLAIPWWIWPIVALVALAAWQVTRGWRQVYAPIIRGGPVLTLAFTEPADDVAGYSSVGEAVVATASLEAPLPDGHHLRMGTHRAAQEVPLDAELRAHLHLVPDKLGALNIRADIVDGKGRVVSRRTITLHVVRYGEEIERRYLHLRHHSGASEAVTPREFERWLHERAPELDRETVRHLVRVFEEADYSPRVAGRAEFAAYLAAEGGVQEVSPRAKMA